jgi:hypothetical protein
VTLRTPQLFHNLPCIYVQSYGQRRFFLQVCDSIQQSYSIVAGLLIEFPSSYVSWSCFTYSQEHTCISEISSDLDESSVHPSHALLLIYILVLSSHTSLGIRSGIHPSGFRLRLSYVFWTLVLVVHALEPELLIAMHARETPSVLCLPYFKPFLFL